MLNGAAAADAEVRTERFDALKAWRFDVQQAIAIGMAGHRLDIGAFARQGERHIDEASASIRDAVAAMADMIDEKLFSHDVHQGRIPGCRRRLEAMTQTRRCRCIQEFRQKFRCHRRRRDARPRRGRCLS